MTSIKYSAIYKGNIIPLVIRRIHLLALVHATVVAAAGNITGRAGSLEQPRRRWRPAWRPPGSFWGRPISHGVAEDLINDHWTFDAGTTIAVQLQVRRISSNHVYILRAAYSAPLALTLIASPQAVIIPLTYDFVIFTDFQFRSPNLRKGSIPASWRNLI